MPGVGIGPNKRMSTPAADNPASSALSNIYPDTRVSLPMSTLGLPRAPRAKTRPAAQPSFITKSGVMGATPTRPRTPSVPKYLRSLESAIVVSPPLAGGLAASHRQGYEERSAQG